MPEHNVLILGASYGSLLASKLMLAGHHVSLVCLPNEASLINAEGFRVRMPLKEREGTIEIDSRALPGKVHAGGPGDFDPRNFDLIGLAMQEPQYRSPGVRDLLEAIARQNGKEHPAIDAIVALVDRRLEDNRAQSPSGRAE